LVFTPDFDTWGKTWKENPDPFGNRKPKHSPTDPPKNPKDPKDDEDEMITLYRGVYANHPGYHDAENGMAVPWGLEGGHNNPARHNAGDNYSIFTSWTRTKKIAKAFAGKGGIVLIKKFKKSQTLESPDKFNEGEVLIPGIVTGAYPQHLK
jgi:hypothetical protein